jgi:predicted transcriptional regulator
MAAKKEKPLNDQTITIRLEPEDAKRLEELAELATEKTGLEVTKSWVLRESLRNSYNALKKKYEDM